VDSLHVGGLIVSVGSPLDIAAKLNRLQERSTLPLLIASDLEGVENTFIKIYMYHFLINIFIKQEVKVRF
jgi:hypothetical protein